MAHDYIGVLIYPQADAIRGAADSRTGRRQGHGVDAIGGRSGRTPEPLKPAEPFRDLVPTGENPAHDLSSTVSPGSKYLEIAAMGCVFRRDSAAERWVRDRRGRGA
jgi:hypothetical protein